MKARATAAGGKMGLAWAAATAERDDGGVGVGQSVLGLGRLSPSRVCVCVGVGSLSSLSLSLSVSPHYLCFLAFYFSFFLQLSPLGLLLEFFFFSMGHGLLPLGLAGWACNSRRGPELKTKGAQALIFFEKFNLLKKFWAQGARAPLGLSLGPSQMRNLDK